tara:strand:+ start:329 stop:433 length:105 start_codon:yes stop_codon:yes gene_type:complete
MALKFNRRWQKISKDMMKRLVTNPLAPHNKKEVK